MFFNLKSVCLFNSVVRQLLINYVCYISVSFYLLKLFFHSVIHHIKCCWRLRIYQYHSFWACGEQLVIKVCITQWNFMEWFASLFIQHHTSEHPLIPSLFLLYLIICLFLVPFHLKVLSIIGLMLYFLITLFVSATLLCRDCSMIILINLISFEIAIIFTIYLYFLNASRLTFCL